MPVHKFHMLRRVRGSKTVYQCADPTCTWREQKHFLLHKMAVCNRCQAEFVLDSYALSLSRPHCGQCNKGAKKVEENPKGFVKSMLEKLTGAA